MSNGPRNLNSPLFSGKWCNADGSLTLTAQTVVRRFWERTGYAPGVDTAWNGMESDIAYLSSQAAIAAASNAESTAQSASALAAMRSQSSPAIDAQKLYAVAIQSLIRANQAEANALKALEKAEELTRLLLTTRTPRDGISSDESMVFTIMNRPWPSSPNPSSKA